VTGVTGRGERAGRRDGDDHAFGAVFEKSAMINNITLIFYVALS
jgi:hypothetical protein